MSWQDVVYDNMLSIAEAQRIALKKRDMAQKVAAILSENEATLVDIDDIFDAAKFYLSVTLRQTDR